jgi:hypothetical protein
VQPATFAEWSASLASDPGGNFSPWVARSTSTYGSATSALSQVESYPWVWRNLLNLDNGGTIDLTWESEHPRKGITVESRNYVPKGPHSFREYSQMLCTGALTWESEWFHANKEYRDHHPKLTAEGSVLVWLNGMFISALALGIPLTPPFMSRESDIHGQWFYSLPAVSQRRADPSSQTVFEALTDKYTGLAARSDAHVKHLITQHATTMDGFGLYRSLCLYFGRKHSAITGLSRMIVPEFPSMTGTLIAYTTAALDFVYRCLFQGIFINEIWLVRQFLGNMSVALCQFVEARYLIDLALLDPMHDGIHLPHSWRIEELSESIAYSCHSGGRAHLLTNVTRLTPNLGARQQRPYVPSPAPYRAVRALADDTDPQAALDDVLAVHGISEGGCYKCGGEHPVHLCPDYATMDRRALTALNRAVAWQLRQPQHGGPPNPGARASDPAAATPAANTPGATRALRALLADNTPADVTLALRALMDGATPAEDAPHADEDVDAPDFH